MEDRLVKPQPDTLSARDESEAPVKPNRLQEVVELGMLLTGDPLQVFGRIAHLIGVFLNVPVVCLSEIRGDVLNFLSVYVNGEVITEAGRCPLSASPCATVKKTKDMRIYDQVAEKFPDAPFLKKYNAFSYCGFPSLDRSGNVVAVTCLLDDKPHNFTDEEKSVLKILGQRIAMEIEQEKYAVERRAAEERLRLSEQRYRYIVKTIPQGIQENDINGIVTFSNLAHSRMHGYRDDELVGKAIWDMVASDEERVKLKGYLERLVLEQPPPTMYITQDRTKDGRIIDIEVDWDYKRDEDGNLTGFISVISDITERKIEEDAIFKMAYHDQLTGLPNRALLMDRLNHVLEEGKRYNKLAAILFLDLDNFKNINDTMGHTEGDNLLRNVVRRVKKHVRSSDTMARHGGDEFVILIQDIQKVENITKVIEKIYSEFEEPFTLNSQEFFVTTSIGISVFPDDGEEAETLLKHADVAMYRAKEEGKNTYQFYTPAMNAKTMEIVKTHSMLHKALKNEEFVLHYQPQINIVTGEITGIEALVRWQSPERGLVFPGTFIPLAEDSGLIVPLGEWVLSEACAQNMFWQEKGLKPVSISVNLSMRQLKQKDFSDTVKRILKDSRLEPGYLEFEVTESMVMGDVRSAMEIFHELKAIGIRLSIDDFGTGYSSFEYLKQLPIDMLKIGMPFVRNIALNPDDAAIAKAIVEVAHIMGLDVIAEGVETAEQLAILIDLNCNKIQGYLLSKPIPSSNALEVFLNNDWRFVMSESTGAGNGI
ncbi:MAG: EAL domain-containing protein [Nitrospirae bacterium]|nr:EAL domain-containing protein [Nitrospirota bacterium]